MVCEGNICRSPIAVAFLQRDMPLVGVMSAGTRALVGQGANSVAVQLMDDRGLNIRSHVSTLLTPEHVRNAHLVLTMTRAQRDLIEMNYPYARGKTYRLGDHDDLDVVDPYQRGPFIFELAVAQIEQGVSRWLDTIARLSH
ncbi:low molecular weight phosphotyrosine protein phosphatase [Caballeronia sp. dw_19]|uniref:arsenate reductase/protein-tyrosine-phosphatase family protein n=1 Tax=Caballeronia sp. dw_19 TaxID=2719791 RepID=UPI001BD39D8F|nr:low molecular weight phosphotyrosine protein phosphatase [Caballeronia sp. dw_19]